MPRSSAGDPSLATYGALLDAVRGLRWRARRASRLAVPGIHPSRVRGTSAEFTEYRPYRQGDEVRRIDWRLLARTDRAQIRLSEERAVTPTVIVLDASASMEFPVGQRSKWVAARELAIGLAAVAQSGGDPVGLTLVGDPVRILPPRTRRGTVADLIRVVASAPAGGSAPVAPAVRAALRRAARIVVVSDLLGDGDDVLHAAAAGMAAGRDVYALHVIAPHELAPPVEIAMAQDPEDPTVRRPLPAAARAEYVRAFAAWRVDVAQRWLASGAAYRAVVTDAEPTAHVIRRIVGGEPALASAPEGV